ncbi:MAG: FixH family protein [Acidobacteria bacterium]|nr:FixH family protein [Acidobacteriota bacterium]
MKTKTVVVTLVLFTALLFVAACRDASSSGDNKVIKSTKSGDMTITLSSATGGLKNGENELMVTFTDASGKPVDVGAASLNFHMAAMGSMAEMNDRATLTTTETPGKYRAHVNIEMAGTWEAQVKYQGANGTGQVSMSVQAK